MVGERTWIDEKANDLEILWFSLPLQEYMFKLVLLSDGVATT